MNYKFFKYNLSVAIKIISLYIPSSSIFNSRGKKYIHAISSCVAEFFNSPHSYLPALSTHLCTDPLPYLSLVTSNIGARSVMMELKI